MTFQAYIETIKEKTGLGPNDFVRLAAAKGFGPTTKAGEIVAWLAADYGLGRGHAMAIVNILKAAAEGGRTPDTERIDKLFSGARANWRGAVDKLIAAAGLWGEVGLAPTDTYLSLTKAGKKFAILAPTAKHLDIGIKRKGADATARFVEAGKWNAMVTHRVQVTNPAEIDKDVLAWIRAAYEAA